MAAGETYGQHVVCAGFAVKRILERFAADEIYPDDIFLLNDPYLAAIHNSDVYVDFANPLSERTCGLERNIRSRQ